MTLIVIVLIFFVSRHLVYGHFGPLCSSSVLQRRTRHCIIIDIDPNSSVFVLNKLAAVWFVIIQVQGFERKCIDRIGGLDCGYLSILGGKY